MRLKKPTKRPSWTGSKYKVGDIIIKKDGDFLATITWCGFKVYHLKSRLGLHSVSQCYIDQCYRYPTEEEKAQLL